MTNCFFMTVNPSSSDFVCSSHTAPNSLCKAASKAATESSHSNRSWVADGGIHPNTPLQIFLLSLASPNLISSEVSYQMTFLNPHKPPISSLSIHFTSNFQLLRSFESWDCRSLVPRISCLLYCIQLGEKS